jgi:hypothetical protein
VPLATPVIVTPPEAPMTSIVVFGWGDVPMNCSARVIVRNAHCAEVELLPVPLASLP